MSTENPLTDDELAKLAELASKATPGEWFFDDVPGDYGIITNADGVEPIVFVAPGNLDPQERRNLLFCAEARNGVPALIAECQAARVHQARRDEGGEVERMRLLKRCQHYIIALRQRVYGRTHGEPVTDAELNELGGRCIPDLDAATAPTPGTEGGGKC